MAETTSQRAALPPDQLLFSPEQIRALFGLDDVQQVYRLIRARAFGDPAKLPRRGRLIQVPRAAVMAYAQADDSGATA